MSCLSCGKESLIRFKDPLEPDTFFCSPECIKSYNGHVRNIWTVICECGYKTRDPDQMHRHLEKYCPKTIESRCVLDHPHTCKHRHAKEAQA